MAGMGATADEQRVTTRDGRALVHRTVGTGQPTVVFEPGMGSSGRAWGLVQHEVGATSGP
jgi:hypothetical protein